MGKHIEEEFALDILKYVLKNKEFFDLQCNGCESPDIQGSVWGIEVTKAQAKTQGEENAVVLNCLGKRVDEIHKDPRVKDLSINYIVNSSGSVFAAGGGKLYRIDYDLVLKQFSVKLKKIQAGIYKTSFRYMGIFIFSGLYFPKDNPCNADDLLAKLNDIQKGYIIKFKRFFLFDEFYNLLVIDFHKQTYYYRTPYFVKSRLQFRS